jgi:hypothetical protein
VCVCLCISLSLLGYGSVKVPLSLLGNGYVFYAVRVVSKEIMLLVLPRTSCFCFFKYCFLENLAQDRDSRRALVNMVMDLRVLE